MANATGTNKCADCGLPIQENPEHERAPCPKCGSLERIQIRVMNEGIEVSDRAIAVLSEFIDSSTEEAADASATALTEIALWVDETNDLTVRHVAEGGIAPSKVDAPLGPYTEIQVRDIVKTIRSDRVDRKKDKWDRIKTFVGWGFAAIMVLIAYLVPDRKQIST